MGYFIPLMTMFELDSSLEMPPGILPSYRLKTKACVNNGNTNSSFPLNSYYVSFSALLFTCIIYGMESPQYYEAGNTMNPIKQMRKSKE